MAKLQLASGTYYFRCPGCNQVHGFNHLWEFNNNLDKPTISPSLLVRSGHFASSGCWCKFNEENPDNPSGFTCYRCHSFIKNGMIQFLDDCSHALAGTTVELLEIDSPLF